jgi:hypothetical protein
LNFVMTTRGLRSRIARTFAYSRRGVEVRSFSPDEDALIQELRRRKYTMAKIADACANRFGHRRATGTIGTRLRALTTRAEAVDA